MVKLRPIFKTLLAILLTGLCCPATAEAVEEFHFYGDYDFSWNGIHLGGLALGIDEEKGRYHVQLEVRSQGVVNLFTRHSDNTEVTGRLDAVAYKPEHYDSHYWTKKKPRHIEFAYDAAGVMTKEIVEPPEDRTERPLAPQSLKNDSYDPLSGLLAIRAGAQQWRGFDGKRLYEIKIARGDNSSFAAKNASAFILSRTPLGGLTAKEKTDYDKGEPPLTLYFSDDARRVPLGVRVRLYGAIKGELVKECITWAACQIH